MKTTLKTIEKILNGYGAEVERVKANGKTYLKITDGARVLYLHKVCGGIAEEADCIGSLNAWLVPYEDINLTYQYWADLDAWFKWFGEQIPDYYDEETGEEGWIEG